MNSKKGQLISLPAAINLLAGIIVFVTILIVADKVLHLRVGDSESEEEINSILQELKKTDQLTKFVTLNPDEFIIFFRSDKEYFIQAAEYPPRSEGMNNLLGSNFPSTSGGLKLYYFKKPCVGSCYCKLKGFSEGEVDNLEVPENLSDNFRTQVESKLLVQSDSVSPCVELEIDPVEEFKIVQMGTAKKIADNGVAANLPTSMTVMNYGGVALAPGGEFGDEYFFKRVGEEFLACKSAEQCQ